MENKTKKQVIQFKKKAQNFKKNNNKKSPRITAVYKAWRTMGE